MVWFLASKESRHERTNQSLPGSSEALAAKDGSKQVGTHKVTTTTTSSILLLLLPRCLILFLGSFMI